MTLWKLIFTGAICVSLSACSAFRPGKGPDTAYKEAKASGDLMLPPELTRPEASSRYVVPGTAGEPITQNTLLPVIDSARLVRSGERAWLEINGAPEDVWVPLKRFLEHQGYAIAREDLNVGLMETEWTSDEGKALPDAGSFSLKGLLKRLTGDEGNRHRYSVRLERAKRLSSRLFLIYQGRTEVEDPKEAEREINRNNDYKTKTTVSQSIGDWEKESLMMQRFLVHLGIGEQRAAGILSDEDARNLVSVAYLERLDGRQTLVLKTSRRSSWSLTQQALERIGFTKDKTQAEQGLIQGHFVKANSREDEGPSGHLAKVVQSHYGYDRALRVVVQPIGAVVRVVATDGSGKLLPKPFEDALMDALLAEIQ